MRSHSQVLKCGPIFWGATIQCTAGAKHRDEGDQIGANQVTVMSWEQAEEMLWGRGSAWLGPALQRG